MTDSAEDLVFLDDVLVQHAGRLRQDTGLSIRTDLQPAYVVGDAKTLHRAVAALVDHACSNAVSAIELEVYRRDAQAVIIVRDDGPHIAAADAARMSSKCHSHLELAARIIANHGGTLTVTDSSACANAVSVRLPSTRQYLPNTPVPQWVSDTR